MVCGCWLVNMQVFAVVKTGWCLLKEKAGVMITLIAGSGGFQASTAPRRLIFAFFLDFRDELLDRGFVVGVQFRI